MAAGPTATITRYADQGLGLLRGIDPHLAMKFCPQCGTRLDLGSLFCSACGTKQPDAAAIRDDPGLGWVPMERAHGPSLMSRWRLVVPIAVVVVIVVVIVATRDRSESCSDTAERWARLAERVGPDRIEQVRADANSEIVDNDVRIATQQTINYVANTYTLGGSSQIPIPGIQMDSFTDRACSRTYGDAG